jgi:hypothetical protein
MRYTYNEYKKQAMKAISVLITFFLLAFVTLFTVVTILFLK